MTKKNNKQSAALRKKKAKTRKTWGRRIAYTVAFCLAFLTTYFLNSCADHDDMFDAGIKVGNILLADNTMVSPNVYNAEKMNAVGVIFYAKGDTAIAVAPVELGDFSFAESTGTISGVSTDAYSVNGLTSTAALLMSGMNTPAAKACARYASPLSGWYLPSAGELRALAANLNTVAYSMQLINGTPFDDIQYMSSSQDNSSTSNAELYCYCVSLLRGYAVSVSKKEPHRVRPVILVN